MDFVDAIEEEVRQIISSPKNRRGPGLDKVQIFWNEKFGSIYGLLLHGTYLASEKYAVQICNVRY